MTAATLLREVRRAAGLTQGALARAAGTSQSAVARYESGALDPSIGTLTRLLAAAGHRLELYAPAARRATVTAATAAAGMAAELRASGDNPRAALRPALELVDGFRAGSFGAQMAMTRERPATSGDARIDAFIAALVEHLCSGAGVPSPAWVHQLDRFLDRWWFVAGLPGFEAAALAESPIAFSRRGVFITATALDRI